MSALLSRCSSLFTSSRHARNYSLHHDESNSSATVLEKDPDGSTGWRSFSRRAHPVQQSKEGTEGSTSRKDDPAKEEEVPRDGMRLDLRRIDEYYDRRKCAWVIRDTPAPKKKSTTDKYAEFAFTLNRKITEVGEGIPPNIKTSFDIKSPYLKDVGMTVIGQVQGVSWTSKPLQIEDKTIIAFLPKLQDYADNLKAKKKTEDESLRLSHLSFLLAFIRAEYASTLAELASLLSHGEITFDLLWAIYVPRAILYTACPVTGEPRAVRLLQAELFPPGNGPKLMRRLDVEYVEYNTQYHSSNRALDTPKFGLAKLAVRDIFKFKGTMKITSLPCYPIEWCPAEEDLKARMIQRGKKWAATQGVHHLHYDGMGFHAVKDGYMKISVNSRIMVDWKTFGQTMPNYSFPEVKKMLSGEDLDMHPPTFNPAFVQDDPLTYIPPNLAGSKNATPAPVYSTDMKERAETEEELNDLDYLLASPIVYGFSLSDKLWLEYNVEHVNKFEWDEEPFENLVLAKDQKELVKSLVEAHGMDNSGFDDFVKGKGMGLVINLFGNPGVGKSLTAEATSEHMRKPLYVVGAGDLGTSAGLLDENLTRIFKISAGWGAVLLIDEADVFLEERSFHDLERNAMVAVFLRELEYFRGILFLTTNRVRTFDEAFQSRIHVSLHYEDLSSSAKRQIWVAFLKKAKYGKLKELTESMQNAGLSKDELHDLGEKKVNGRQIKNVVRTASALALSRKQEFGYKHLIEVLAMLERFDVTNPMYQ